MRKGLILLFTVAVLIGGAVYYKNQSSYTIYGNSQKDQPLLEEIMVAENETEEPVVDERSPEDIALDKRLDEERKRNEKTYREQGIIGTSLQTTIDTPSFSIDEIASMLDTLETYRRENADRFPEPADDGTTRQTPDPRILKMLYEEKPGILQQFEDENLEAWEVKKLDGAYTIIIVGRLSDGQWQVLLDGDVYQLREELADGD